MPIVFIIPNDTLTTHTSTGAAIPFAIYSPISNSFGVLHGYRHVILPKPMLRLLPKTLLVSNETGSLRILSEKEWRGIGITQSLGWEHYEVHGTL